MVVALLAWPALSGTFIYDDENLAVHPHLDGRDDLLAAFGRNSGAYLERQDDVAVRGAATWRPLSMLSLLLVQAAAGPVPWVHHLVSLGLHLMVVALLGLILFRRGTDGLAAGLILAGFALHPALGEAWLWINGRSDVLAGVFLAGAGVLLMDRSDAPWRTPRILGLAALLAGGALCKETFLPAAGFLVAAAVAEQRGDVRRNATWAGALAFAAAVFWFGRAATLEAGEGTGLSSPATLLARVPGLLGLGLETLLVPAARGMRYLGWLLDGLTAAGLLATAGLAAAVGLLWWRGRGVAAVLLCGAAVTLLPAGLVGDAFWLGFDRYLYLPAVLVVLALAGARRPSWPIAGLALPWLGAAAWGLLGTARTYASPAEFALGLAALRPDEPTGALLAAQEALRSGRPEVALALLEERPTTTERAVPPALTHQLAAAYLAVGRPDRAGALVEKAAAAFPGHPNLRFDLMALRMAQRRPDEALALAAELLGEPSQRAAVRDQLRRWAAEARLPEEVRAACARLAGDTP